MRILVIENVNYEDYPTGGIMNFYRNMVGAFGRELLMAGITTDAITPVGLWTKREINGVEYDYFSMARIKPTSKKPIVPERIKNCAHVRKYIRKILDRDDYDVIFTRTPEVMYFIPDEYMKKTCNYLPGVGNPLVISRYAWARNLASIYDRFFQMPKASKARWLLAAADYNARSKFAGRSRGLIRTENVIQFPTRYDARYYKVQRQQRSGNDSVYVTVGRLGWFKGWKLMIDAFKIVSNKIENTKLYFVGNGEDKEKIEEYIDDIGLKSKVFLLGKKTPQEIGMLLNASDVFVMGSMAEGWATSLVEACACGLPCVVTDFSSAKEMIKDGENGYVVTSRNEKEFANRMIDALSLDKNAVIEYDKRFEKYSTSHLKDDLIKILS